MIDDRPDEYTLRAAIALALRAPSLHNTQPWTWRFTGRTIQLRADPRRKLAYADPEGRELLISCGCALHHLTVAAAAMGWAAKVTRMTSDLVAAVELNRHEPSDDDIAAASAIARRRSDRRQFSAPPAPTELARLTRTAADSGVQLRPPGRDALRNALAEARLLRAAAPAYAEELAAWSGRRYTADGIPSRAVPPYGTTVGTRRFSWPGLAADDGTDQAAVAVLSTSADTPLDHLRAGEAASAVLLEATRLGLATCIFTEPLELPTARAMLYGGAVPQLAIRIGRTAEAPLPAVPRRPIDEVAQPLGKAARPAPVPAPPAPGRP
ncbi:Acg family FMN-binding oxidoreductase [Amycolatopsis benzoatilytica]|uniref:Acg family FMN-binding oxidoreductase n=1 Tax=Amycolatopsis benzoatilytica TaxID=346045 RepID=UPI00036E296F|nr:hypothetical protein [Amycolatopsis benzoatilytica]